MKRARIQQLQYLEVNSKHTAWQQNEIIFSKTTYYLGSKLRLEENLTSSRAARLGQ